MFPHPDTYIKFNAMYNMSYIAIIKRQIYLQRMRKKT